MAGSNGLTKNLTINREEEKKDFCERDSSVQTYTKPTSAQSWLNPAYVGNIISTTQVPSTNPSPTNLTPIQFVETVYFDAGTTNNPINAPTLSDFLTFIARHYYLEQVMTFRIHFVNLNLENPAVFNAIVIQFPDPAWGRAGIGLGVLPDSATEASFTVFNANQPAIAHAAGINSQINSIDPRLFIFSNNLGATSPLFEVIDNSVGAVTTLTRDWVIASYTVNALAWGTAARQAGGFHDTILRQTISSASSAISAVAPGYGAGAYHCNFFTAGSAAPSTVVFYVKADGRMRATLVASAAYTTAVLFDPVSGEFGQAVSSNRYKDHIVDADPVVDMGFFDLIHPRTFQYIGDATNKKVLGVIAEELDAVLPAALKPSILSYETYVPDPVNAPDVTATRLSGINDHFLVSAILANQRRLNDKIAALTARVTTLEGH